MRDVFVLGRPYKVKAGQQQRIIETDMELIP